MKVIGLSGSQGGGKSSLLNELESRGWRLDKFRVSRAVQAELGWDSLERVMDSPKTMMDFQEQVFLQKYKHDFILSTNANHDCDKENIILTERTFADIWAYTSMWTWRFHDQDKFDLNEALSFLTQFRAKCVKAQNEVYSGIMLLPLMDHIVWEDDVHRAAQADAKSMYEEVQIFVERKMPIITKRLIITAKSVNDRATSVETFLRTI